MVREDIEKLLYNDENEYDVYSGSAEIENFYKKYIYYSYYLLLLIVSLQQFHSLYLPIYYHIRKL